MSTPKQLTLRTFTFAAACALAAPPDVAIAQSPNVKLTVGPGTATTPGANNVPLEFRLLGDTTTGNAFDLLAERDLWALTFRLPPVLPPTACPPPTPQTIRATPSDAACTYASFQYYAPSLVPEAFLAVWDGGHHSLMPAGHTFTVYVHGVAAPGANVYELRIQVVTTMPTLALAEVEFPRVTVRSRNLHRGVGDTTSEVLVYPHAQGVARMSPLANLPTSGARFNHPGPMSMQFLSYYSTSETNPPVLFFGSRDKDGHYKEFQASAPTADHMQLSIFNYPSGNTVPDNDYLSPYAATLGIVRSDWYDAAQEYRSWLLNQAPGARPVWLVKSNGSYLPPLAQRNPADPDERALPAQLLNADMFFTFDTPVPTRDFSQWQTDATVQRGFYGATTTTPSIVYHGHSIDAPGTLVGCGDWHLWAPTFLSALPHTATSWGPYILFKLYDQRAQTYSSPLVPGFTGSADQYRLTSYEGCPVTGFDPLLQVLCNAWTAPAPMVQTFCGAFMKTVALNAQSLGARSIYLDTFTYEGSRMCHADSSLHRHPVGGGSYMTAALRGNVDTMIKATHVADPEFFASSEAPGEAFSDVVPLVFEHTAPDNLPTFERSLPLYSAVYHDFQLTSRIQNRSNNPVTAFNNAFARRATAYSSYFGDIPSGGSILSNVAMATNLLDPGFVQAATLLQSWVGVTKQTAVRPFFHTGRRLRDVPHTAPRLPTSYAPGYYAAWIDAAGQQPTVYLSTWADPTVANKFGIMAINWTDVGDSFPPSSVVGGNQPVTVTLDAGKLGVLPGNYSVDQVTATGQVNVGTVPINTSISVPVTIPALTAMFVIFTKV